MSIRVRTGAAGILSALGVLIGYATAVEPYAISLVEFELLCSRLPRSFDGLTILQISDTHVRKVGRRERKIAAMVSTMNPDIIAITGDLVHTPSGIQPFLTMAKAFHARLGIFAVFGNSEHKNGILSEEFAQILNGNGIQPILNHSTRIDGGTDAIYVCGVDDPVTHNDDLAKALDGVPDEAFKLLLMHSPDNIGEAAHRGVDLVLSGHTHGGQVRLPLVGPLYTHSMHGQRMSSGYYGGRRLRPLIGRNPGHTQLYVTRGAGVSGLALRFLCQPEITLITLRAL